MYRTHNNVLNNWEKYDNLDDDEVIHKSIDIKRIHIYSGVYFIHIIGVVIYISLILQASGVYVGGSSIHTSSFDLIFYTIFAVIDSLVFLRAWLSREEWESSEMTFQATFPLDRCCIRGKSKRRPKVDRIDVKEGKNGNEAVFNNRYRMKITDFNAIWKPLQFKTYIQLSFGITGFILLLWFRSLILYQDYNGVGSLTATGKSSCTRNRSPNVGGFLKFVYNPNGYFPRNDYDTIDTSLDSSFDYGKYQFCTINRRWGNTTGIQNVYGNFSNHAFGLRHSGLADSSIKPYIYPENVEMCGGVDTGFVNLPKDNINIVKAEAGRGVKICTTCLEWLRSYEADLTTSDYEHCVRDGNNLAFETLFCTFCPPHKSGTTGWLSGEDSRDIEAAGTFRITFMITTMYMIYFPFRLILIWFYVAPIARLLKKNKNTKKKNKK